MDGFASGNYAFESNTINGIDWTNNGVLWLLWSMGTNSAQSPGLGMYDLTFSTVPEPSTYALFGLGVLALVNAARRRTS